MSPVTLCKGDFMDDEYRELKTTEETCKRAEQDAARALRIAESYRGSTHSEIVAGQPSMLAHVVRLGAIAHDLRLLHTNYARWVADSAWRARIEPRAKEWLRQHYAVDEMVPTTREEVEAADAALASALAAEGREKPKCSKCGDTGILYNDVQRDDNEAPLCDCPAGSGKEKRHA